MSNIGNISKVGNINQMATIFPTLKACTVGKESFGPLKVSRSENVLVALLYILVTRENPKLVCKTELYWSKIMREDQLQTIFGSISVS